jgi:adenylosuccinate lyase
MLAVREGGDRQELHECIRGHAMVVAERRTQGAPNDLMERLAKDPRFARVAARAAEFNDPARLTGRAAEQVAAFFEREVAPVLERWGGRSRVSSEIDV